MSTFQSLHQNPPKSLQDARIASLENTIKELRQYRTKTRKNRNLVVMLCVKYESLFESIVSKLETKGA